MKDFLSLFNKKKNMVPQKPGKTSLLSLLGNDAFVDWVLIISVTSLMAAALIGVGGYVYVNAVNELESEMSVSSATHAAIRFDAKKLKDIVTLFDARADEKVMLMKGYNSLKDPSLP